MPCPDGYCENSAGDCYDCGPGGGDGGWNDPGGGGGGDTCFQAGTKIETAEGLKNIEDIKVGDVVKSYDIKNSKITESKVYETFKHKDTPNGLLLNGIIKTTTNHPFYTSDDKWVEAINLKSGDRILHVDGEYHKVKTLETLNHSTTVYNFEVEETHNYFAEGYLVHNKYISDEATPRGIPPADKLESTGPGLGFMNRRNRRRSNTLYNPYGIGRIDEDGGCCWDAGTWYVYCIGTGFNAHWSNPVSECASGAVIPGDTSHWFPTSNSCTSGTSSGNNPCHCPGTTVSGYGFVSCGQYFSLISSVPGDGSGGTIGGEHGGRTIPPVPKRRGGYICPDGYTDIDEFGNNIC